MPKNISKGWFYRPFVFFKSTVRIVSPEMLTSFRKLIFLTDMAHPVAIIDLGTNTCNLLIAAYEQKSFRILYQGKEVVKLGKTGFSKNLLTEDGLQRTILALKKHQEKIGEFEPVKTWAFATSAIREAKNREWFQETLKNETGIGLQIISGDKEAELIFKGVKLAFEQIENHSLILDIGGGSNEFILTELSESIWQQSFPLGMARIIEQIPPSDPITPEEISQISSYFESQLDLLWNRTINTPISSLIGCSGAFDTLVDLIDQTDPGTKTRIRQEIKTDDFNRIYNMLIRSTTLERQQMKGLETLR
ncbi:MAG: hypothetical protein WC384_21695, partial [Prolixibacteraceae bacterium]